MAKILVADDGWSYRMIYGKFLQNAGYEVVTASSGEEALQKLQEEKFDLLLTDLNMVPDGMDGTDLLKEAKKLHPQMPVILASNDEDVEKIAKEDGFNDYHYKADPEESLVKKIKELFLEYVQ